MGTPWCPLMVLSWSSVRKLNVECNCNRDPSGCVWGVDADGLLPHHHHHFRLHPAGEPFDLGRIESLPSLLRMSLLLRRHRLLGLGRLHLMRLWGFQWLDCCYLLLGFHCRRQFPVDGLFRHRQFHDDRWFFRHFYCLYCFF